MAQDWIGKLFLLAMSTTSDAEALSALEMIKAVLKKKGLDAHVIADAMNRVSASPDDDRYDLSSILRASVSEGSNPSSYQTDWDREKEAQDVEWQSAFYAHFQTDITPVDENGAEQDRDARFSVITGATLWPTESNLEEEGAEAVKAEKKVTNAERQTAPPTNSGSDSGEQAGKSEPRRDRERTGNKAKKRVRGKPLGRRKTKA